MLYRCIRVICFALLATAALCPSPAGATVLIQNIRHWSAPDHTRIVIDTSSAPKYVVDKTDHRLNIDFQDTAPKKTVPTRIVLNKTGIKKIFLTRRPDRTVRISLTLSGKIETRIFKLKKFQDKPDRIVIDIGLPEVEKEESRSREAIKGRGKDKIIVIDPGHGGDDPGAIGRNGTREKTIVLAISKRLQKIINGGSGYRAFLTRKGDYYVSFKKRLTIAREYGADLFVSIHADAFRGRSARGSSVYCLSLRGAGSEAGRLLASHENLSDIVGGVPETESSDESDPIVLNMYQTNTINLSKTFGNHVLKRLEGSSHIKHAVVQEAPFRVLKLPDIPSLLIETAFISNPGEEQMLRSGQFQKRIATAIAEAVYDFSPVSPADRMKKLAAFPEDTVKKQKTRYYKVRRGDTIHGIARKYDTTAAEIMQINRIKAENPLYIGKRLKLPAPVSDQIRPETQDRKSKPSKAKDDTIVYKIKRGDTLTGIARRYHTDVDELARTNQLKLDAPLYIGRKIRIVPGDEKTPGGQPDEERPTQAPSSGVFIYRVRPGDSLLTIARRCNSSVEALQELNRMKPDDVLYINQELIVPQEPADDETSEEKHDGRAVH
jgi:N-acetylmuramoyl-L-alanine amidase